MANATSTQLQQLYVAYFGRAADPTGLDYWTERGISTAAFAANMYAQNEFKSAYGSLSVASQVNQIYKNLFDREADVTGLTYWTQQINLGNLQLAEIANDLIWAAENNSGSADDKTALSNRTTAATAYTAQVKTSTSSILAYQAESTSPWVSGSNITEAINYLSGIDKDTAYTAAGVKASVDTITATGVPAAAVAGKTFTLTANTDSLVGSSAGDNFNSSSSTFSSDDVIDGGAGSDTLSTTAAAAGSVIGNLTSIETIKVTNGAAATNDYAINLIGATGVTEVISRLSTGEVSFDNLQNIAKVTNFGGQALSETTAGFLNSLTSGSADSISLKVDGGANTTFLVGGTTDTNEFETINIESAGVTKNTIAGIKDAGGNAMADTSLINVTGAAWLDITLAGGKADSTFDASSSAGNITVTTGGNFDIVKGSPQDDTFDATGGILGNTSLKTYTGGAGTDTIKLAENVSATTLNTTDSTTDHSLTGFETVEMVASVLEATQGNVALALDASKFSEATSIKATISNLDTGNTDSSGVTITGMATTQSVSFTAYEAATQGVTDLDVTLATKTGASDSVSVTSTNPTDTTRVNKLDTLSVTGAIETLNLALDADNVSTTSGTTIADLDVSSTATVNITGSGGLTIGTADLSDGSGTGVTSVIDASAATGNLIFGSSSADFKETNSEEFTITLGSGTNKIYAGAVAIDNDSYIGTTGTDTLYLTEANGSGTAVETTVTKIDNVIITPGLAAHDGPIDLSNFTDVTEVTIASAAQIGSENLELKDIASGQVISLDPAAGAGAFQADALTFTNATGVTGLTLTLDGITGMHSGGVDITTNAGTLNITDKIQGADGFYENAKVDLTGSAATAKVTGLTLSGGGLSAATTDAVFEVTGTSNVEIATIDATALSSDLDIDAVTTKAGFTVNLGSGNNMITVHEDDIVQDQMVLDGGDGSDEMTVVDLAATLYRPKLTSIEKLDLDMTAGTATELSLLESTGVQTIEIAFDDLDVNLTVSGATEVTSYVLHDHTEATADVVTLGSSATLDLIADGAAVLGNAHTKIWTPDATTMTVKLGGSVSGGDKDTAVIDLDTLTAAKVTNLTLGGNDIDSSTNAEYIGAIDFETLSAALLTDLTIDADQGDVTLGTITATKLATVTVTGDNDVAFGGTSDTTAISSFDASAATGGVTIGATVDFTSAADIKLGTAADTLTLDILTESNVTVDAGEKTGTDVNDTLQYAGANNQGLTVVDLSSTTDQVTQINGAINSGVQKNFESVNLSGFTGSFGANITGSAEANTIVGTINADTIIGGEEGDTITGGKGADTISLTETTAKQDFIRLEDTVANNGLDTITGLSATDMISLDKSDYGLGGTATDDAANTAISSLYYEGAAGSMIAATTYNVVVLTGASYATVAAAEDATTTNSTSAVDAFVIFHDTGTTEAVMYYDSVLGTDAGSAIADVGVIKFTDVASASALGTLLSASNFELIA